MKILILLHDYTHVIGHVSIVVLVDLYVKTCIRRGDFVINTAL